MRLSRSPCSGTKISFESLASARAAGLRVVAVTGTLPPDRLAEANALTERVDLRLMRRLLAPTG